MPQSIALSHATMRTIKQNLFWAFVSTSWASPVAASVLYLFTGWLLADHRECRHGFQQRERGAEQSLPAPPLCLRAGRVVGPTGAAHTRDECRRLELQNNRRRVDGAVPREKDRRERSVVAGG